MEITELSAILRQNGIVGAGGAGFPAYGKLSPAADVILLNCAECEPLLTLHRQVLAEHAQEILKALHLVARTLDAEAVIGIKSEYKRTVRALEQFIGEYPEMSIHQLLGAYPMGDEVVLIYEATGRVVRPGGLPIECGAAVFNVETMYNIYRAVWENHPVTEKYVTIAGAVEHPVTVRVPIGMQIREVVALAGRVTTADPVYLLGGPMMGSFGSELQPVTKTTNGVIVLPAEHPLAYRKRPNIANALARAASCCCQCRTCTDLCPRHALGHPIEPHAFMRAAANRDVQSVEPFVNTFFCSSCGLCELYSCPQGLSPRSIMAQYKSGLRRSGMKPPKVTPQPVNPAREYRRAPEERLTARLGLLEYEAEAPLQDVLQRVSRVKINLSQHIGVPAGALVKTGDRVQAQQVIAEAAEGLSVSIHASISGRVTEVTDRYIVLSGEER